MAFLSNRTGTDELWIADADGGNPFQLTHLDAGPLSDVAWEPDGESIAVSSVAGKVLLVSIETGGSQIVFDGLPFTDEIASNLAFARDGKSIYVSSQPGTGEKYELLKVPVTGGEGGRRDYYEFCGITGRAFSILLARRIFDRSAGDGDIEAICGGRRRRTLCSGFGRVGRRARWAVSGEQKFDD
jgi:Tol biopolymer transport system component